LSGRRDDLTREHPRILNRLHQLLRDLVPGGADLGLCAEKAAALLRRVRPATAIDACRRDLARDLLADLRRLDQRLADNEQHIKTAVAASGTHLTEIYGIGAVLAAKILGHVGDATRFPTADHFASYTGTAPLDASSGNHNRHRLNTGGNRQLNAALHTIALCQTHRQAPDTPTTSAKSPKARHLPKQRRALKRRLSNVIYRQIIKDQRSLSTPTT
jgi:transposase